MKCLTDVTRRSHAVSRKCRVFRDVSTRSLITYRRFGRTYRLRFLARGVRKSTVVTLACVVPSTEDGGSVLPRNVGTVAPITGVHIAAPLQTQHAPHGHGPVLHQAQPHNRRQLMPAFTRHGYRALGPTNTPCYTATRPSRGGGTLVHLLQFPDVRMELRPHEPPPPQRRAHSVISATSLDLPPLPPIRVRHDVLDTTQGMHANSCGPLNPQFPNRFWSSKL
jgi:hypothetical protein